MRRQAAALLVLAAACGPADPLRTDTASRPLSAYCQARVNGHAAMIDVETDYIPHVVACENGSAPTEALKAQAVAARTYLYYKLETSGAIADGQGDQVYTCAHPPGPEHLAAAQATVGEVLTYQGDVIAAFFVAGAIPSAASCVAATGDSDATNTEHYVTYNRGLSGTMVHQTTLGLVSPTNYRNRGCQSQNGATCLARHNTSYRDILTFYYGMDIGFETSTGACVPMLPMGMSCTAMATGDTTIDEEGMCFDKQCKTADHFVSVSGGYGNHQFTVPVQKAAVADCTGRWNISFEEAGDYALSAYVKSASTRTEVTYRVRHAGTVDSVVVDQSGDADWVPLGTYAFALGGDQWVELGDDGYKTPPAGAVAIFDALRVTRADVALEDPSGSAHAGDPMSRNDGPPATASIVGTGAPGGCACVAPRGSNPNLGVFAVLALFGVACARLVRGERGRREASARFHQGDLVQEGRRSRRHRHARRR